MESSFRIARVGGIEIGASWTWLIVVAIIMWSLATALFPATYPDLSGGTHLVMALVATVLFFASILLHELGHARRALREGVAIEGITLWLFGGVARLHSNPPSPGAAFRVAVLGPVVSAVLALGFGAAAYAGAQLEIPDAVQGVVDYVARINALVLAFNMAPALPLDGGRILHAWLWHRTGSSSGATVQAANAGRLFGYLLVAVGVLSLFGGDGVGIGGIWLVLIGWFLAQAAGAEGGHAQVRRSLGRMRVRDAMTPDPVAVPSDLAIDAFIDHAWRARHSTYPVVDDGELAGVVSTRAAAAVPAPERTSRRVGDVMTPRARLGVVTADQELADVGQHFDVRRHRLPVVDDGHVVGVLAPSDIARAVELGGDGGTAAPDDRRARRRYPGPFVWVVVAAAFVAVAGFLYVPPLVVMSPGGAVAIEDDIAVDGAPVTEIDGSYQLTAVRIDQTHAFGTLLGWLRSDREVLSIDDVVPPGVDTDEFAESQRDLFTESRELAAAAGARAVGFDVPVDGDGAEVMDVLGDTPAADRLEPGDVIVAVDGNDVPTAATLGERLRGQPAGTSVTLTVEPAGEAGRRRQVDIETAPLPDMASGSGIGVLVTTQNLTVDLPFDISFAPRPDVGGPSAGLAYALAVADLLDEADIAEGRTIAATGTIGVDGAVGPVGGADLKAIAAEDAGADLFVVPDQDAAEAREDSVTVRAARSLDDALEVLRSTS